MQIVQRVQNNFGQQFKLRRRFNCALPRLMAPRPGQSRSFLACVMVVNGSQWFSVMLLCTCQKVQGGERVLCLYQVRVLLPHELLDCLMKADAPHVVDSTLLGHLDKCSRDKFWSHIRNLDGWREHPIFSIMEGNNMSDVIPLCVHGDGAAMKRDDECFVWSFSSFWGSQGEIKDVLHYKFPFAAIHERHMKSHNVPGLRITSLFWKWFRKTIFVSLLEGRDVDSKPRSAVGSRGSLLTFSPGASNALLMRSLL